jgi:hypothetical protein
MLLGANRPQKVGLTAYLASLRRVNDGLSVLKQSNLRSSQKVVQQMTGLLKAGSMQLEELFRQSLAEDSQPVEPLHYITKGSVLPWVSRVEIGADRVPSLRSPVPDVQLAENEYPRSIERFPVLDTCHGLRAPIQCYHDICRSARAVHYFFAIYSRSRGHKHNSSQHHGAV